MKRILVVSLIMAAAILGSNVYAQDVQPDISEEIYGEAIEEKDENQIEEQPETQPEITVTLNGATLNFDVPPQIVNDRTMLPMRAIFEALGAKVTWLGEDKIIFATKGSSMIVMKIGDSSMAVQRAGENGNTVITLDVPPYIENNRTLVPVRAISEALGAKVDWVSETRTVVIVTEQEAAN